MFVTGAIKNPMSSSQDGTFLTPRYTNVPKAVCLDPVVMRLPAECQAVSSILSRVGDKWTVLIVIMLSKGPRRFNDVKRSVGGISQRMLTLTLRGLERDGFVTRTIYPTIPPRVDYELTPLGQSLRVPVELLGSWAFDHIQAIEQARADYDKRQK